MPHTLQGVVTSDQRDKTITIAIASRETHPLYRKQYTKTRKYAAHDKQNLARVGDIVEIAPCRPFSKTVHYDLVRIIERSHARVDLKADVLEVDLPEKTGADALAKAAKETTEAAESETTKNKQSTPKEAA